MPQHLDTLISARYIADPHTLEMHEDARIGIVAGKLTALLPRDLAYDPAETLDFGDAVVLPGFVNAHLHLDLSHLRGVTPRGGDFSHWLKCVTEGRAAPRDLVVGAAEGAAWDMLRTGTTACIDILSPGPGAIEVARALLATGIRALICPELICLAPKLDTPLARACLALSCELRSVLMAECEDDIASYVERCLDGDLLPAIGLSPHAPYTVHPEALTWAVQHAARLLMPLTIHLAESADEREFLATGTGPIRSRFEDFGVDLSRWSPPGVGPIDALLPVVGEHYDSTGRVIYAHGYDATDEEIAALGAARANIAYCPRSRAWLEHKEFRWRAFAEAGCRICIGTDSLASNDDLNLLHELAAARVEQPDVSARELFAAGTINGRIALEARGANTKLPLSRADLQVIAAPNLVQSPDEVLEALLDQCPPHLATMIGGGVRTKRA